MKTKLGKILAIFVTVASIAFVGFAIATTFAAPKFEGVIAQEYFNGYRIAKTAGPDGQWTATRASDEGNVASSKVLAEVLTKVMDEILANHNQEITELTAREPGLEAKITELTAVETAAEAALYTHAEALSTRLAALREREAETGTKIVAATNEAQKLESTIEARRGDVLRLEEQVAELKADTYRLTQVEAQLKDLLNQMRGSLDRAGHRQQLLNGDSATYNPEPTQ